MCPKSSGNVKSQHILQTAMKLRQGNIFTYVCQEFCRQGGGHTSQEGMCGGGGDVWQAACMAGGVHCRGHAWQGACMGGGHAWRGHAWQEKRQRAVRILLECILVFVQ